METQYHNDSEREINLKDLFFCVLLKWRSIILCMIILAIAAGAYSYAQSVALEKKNQELIAEQQLELSAKEKEEAAKAKEEEAAKALNRTEIANVKHVAGVVSEYQQMYDAQKIYNDNSILMQLDPMAVHTVVLQYYIDNHFQVEYPIMGASNNIAATVQAYQSKLISRELYIQLAEALDNEYEEAYFQEMINVDAASAGVGVLKITIYGCDENMVHIMAQCIKGVMAASQETVRESFTEHDVSLVDESYQVEANPDIITGQQKHIQKLDELNAAIVKQEAALTEDELAYLMTLVEMGTVKTSIENEETEESEEAESELPEDEIIVVPASVDIKYVFLGLVLGVALVVVFYGVKYILNNKLKTEEEIEDYFRIQKLGLLAEDEELDVRNPIDRWIINWRDRGKRRFSVEESLQIIQAGIRVTAQKHELHHIFITGCDITEMEIEIISKLKELLSDTGLDIRYGNNAIYHPEALMELADADGVVLIERTGESTYDEIKKEIELCCMHKTTVIGAVVVK